MSYEGYEVWYCRNGHRYGSFDCYNSPSCMYSDERDPLICPVCGTEEFTFDSVNQTNGCECEYISKEDSDKGHKCGCHEKVTQVIGYTFIRCGNCLGIGFVDSPKHFVTSMCGCCINSDVIDPSCVMCYGSGIVFQKSPIVEHVVCPTCTGRGQTPVEIWGITPIKRHLDIECSDELL